MEVHTCSFQVTLHYVKTTLIANAPLQAIWKRPDGKPLAQSSQTPSLINSLAWFNETLQISSDMPYNQQKNTHLTHPLILEIVILPQPGATSRRLGRITIDLSKAVDTVQYRNEKEYQLLEGAKNAYVSLSVVCSAKDVSLVRSKSGAKQGKRQVLGSREKSIRDRSQNQKNMNGKPLIPLFQQFQVEPQSKEQQNVVEVPQMKSTLASIKNSQKKRKEVVELAGLTQNKEDNKKQSDLQQLGKINSQLVHTRGKILESREANDKMREQLQACKRSCQQLQGENDSLYATINHKDNELYECHKQLEEKLQEKKKLDKKLENIKILEMEKNRMEKQKAKMENDKFQIQQKYQAEKRANDLLTQNQRLQKEKKIQEKKRQTVLAELDVARKQILKNEENLKQRDQVIGSLKKELEQSRSLEISLKNVQISLRMQLQKKIEEIQNLKVRLDQKSKSEIKLLSDLKREQKEREEEKRKWQLEVDQLHEQLNIWQAQFEVIQLKYNHWQSWAAQSRDRWVLKSVHEGKISQYELRLRQYQQKEEGMRNNMEIIEEEVTNLYDNLEQRQENEAVLLDKIKALGEEVEDLTAERDKLIGEKERLVLSSRIESNREDFPEGEKRYIKQLRQQNARLTRLLEQNSFAVLEIQKLRREVGVLKREATEGKKSKVANEYESEELKEKVAILMKQNKNLIKKISKLGRQNQLFSQKSAQAAVQVENAGERVKNLEIQVAFLEFKIEQLSRKMRSLEEQNRELQNQYMEGTQQVGSNQVETPLYQLLSNHFPIIRESNQEDLPVSHFNLQQNKKSYSDKAKFLQNSNLQHVGEVIKQLQELLKARGIKDSIPIFQHQNIGINGWGNAQKILQKMQVVLLNLSKEYIKVKKEVMILVAKQVRQGVIQWLLPCEQLIEQAWELLEDLQLNTTP